MTITRRQFMKHSAAAASALAFPMVASSRVLGANDEIRVGLDQREIQTLHTSQRMTLAKIVFSLELVEAHLELLDVGLALRPVRDRFVDLVGLLVARSHHLRQVEIETESHRNPLQQGEADGPDYTHA